MDATALFMDMVERPHNEALEALTDAPPRPAAAVAWLSAHLAAVQRVIYPALAAHEPHSPLLAEQRQATHDLLVHTRTLEQVSAGGPIPAGTTLEGLADHLVDHLVEHGAREHLLLDCLAEHLDDDALERLAMRYDQALRRGPTRPHPWGRHSGALERLRFALDAVRDHVLDVLDARPVPVPRRPRRPAHRPGSWGAYALGTPLPPPPPRDETDRPL